MTVQTYLSLEIPFALSDLFFQTFDRLLPFLLQVFLSLPHFHDMLFFWDTKHIRVSERLQ